MKMSKKTFSIRVDNALLDRIRKQAEDDGRSVNNVIERTLSIAFPVKKDKK